MPMPITPAGVAEKAGAAIYSAGTAKVIGKSITKSYVKGKRNPKAVVETTSVTIQAWEIGAILIGGALGLASIGAYEYLTGNPAREALRGIEKATAPLQLASSASSIPPLSGFASGLANMFGGLLKW